MDLYTIIVAGGTGKRFGSELPKQFLELRGLPVLMHSFKSFIAFNPAIRFILVLPEAYIQFWAELCQKYCFEINHLVVAGGKTRFDSVKNGLALINGSGLVAVHDAVRPLVSMNTLKRCFETAAHKNNAVPVIAPVDSLRQMLTDGSVPVDRNKFVLVQTPQVFDIDLLKKAYQQGYNELFTDDASVVERIGITVNLVEGNRENIKITNKTDLAIAESLFDQTFNNSSK